MYKFRITFLSIWLTFMLGLLFFPGFECRGLAGGMIIGYWPFAIGGEFQSGHSTLAVMFLLSIIQIWLLSWILDTCKSKLRIQYALPLFITGGMVLLFWKSPSYKEWASIMGVYVGDGYVIPRWHYLRASVISLTICGGVFGIYLTIIVGFCLSFMNYLKKILF